MNYDLDLNLDAQYSLVLKIFCLALIKLIADVSFERLQELLSSNSLMDVVNEELDDISSLTNPRGQSLSLNEIIKISEAFEAIQKGDSEKIVELRDIAVSNSSFSDLYLSAGALIQRQGQKRGRSQIDNYTSDKSSLFPLAESLLSSYIRRSKENVTCLCEAKMAQEVVVREITPVQVLLSTLDEVRPSTSSPTYSQGTITVDKKETIFVEVIPVTNFKVIGASILSVNISELIEEPTPYYFSLRSTAVGIGKIQIVVRANDETRLIKLSLQPQIIGIGSDIKEKTLSKTSHVPVRNEKNLDKVGILEITEHTDNEKIFYHYSLKLPDQRRGKFSSGDLSQGGRVNRESYVSNLYEELENIYKEDSSVLMKSLKSYGCELLEQLFPEKLRTVLWQYRDEIDAILVYSKEPLIPWEIIHLKEPNSRGLPKEERFLAQMGLVRWIDTDDGVIEPIPQKITVKSSRAYYMVPDYPQSDDWEPLFDAEAEVRFLKDNFGASRLGASLSNIYKLIEEPAQFDLFHFAGHGLVTDNNISNARLILSIDEETGDYKSSFTVSNAMEASNIGRNNQIIVFNACTSARSGYKLIGIGGFAQAFLSQGAGMFVGPLWAVDDRSARFFIESFYTHILNGTNLSKAAKLAREDTKHEYMGDSTWLAYAIYGHPYATVSTEIGSEI